MPPIVSTPFHKTIIGNYFRFYRSLMASWRFFNDVTVKTKAKRLSALKNTYSGNRCFIMGNGPSLNQMDLNLLANEYVWGSNRCYLLFDRIEWRPQFYVAMDRRVVPDNREQIIELPELLPTTLFFYPLEFRRKEILNSYSNVYWFNEKPLHLDMNRLPEGTFSMNAAKGVFASFTVTISALQLAVYLGFNPIYLIGCDTSYFKQVSINVDESNPDRLTATDNNDQNHFDSSYYGLGKKYHEPHVARMLFHYHEARLVCEASGVVIYNATVGGNLEEFQRMNFDKLFYPK